MKFISKSKLLAILMSLAMLISLMPQMRIVTFASDLVITKQPETITIDYSDSATFSVEVDNPSKVASYQWFQIDDAEHHWKLDGVSAKSDTLWIPSTYWKHDEERFYCVITDYDGNTVQSDVATLNFDPRSNFSTPLLFVGNYGLRPGDNVDLSRIPVADYNVGIGVGQIEFQETETEYRITLTDVNLDLTKKTSPYDYDLSPAFGLFFDMYNTGSMKPINYYFKGQNIIINSHYDSIRKNAGITIDNIVRGEQSDPAVVNMKTVGNGFLYVQGGTIGIRSTGDINFDGNFEIYPDVNNVPSYYNDAIQAVNIGILANSKLNITSNGSGLSSNQDYDKNGRIYGGNIRIEENADVNITAKPFPSSGSSLSAKSSLFCAGKLNVNNAKLTIDSYTDSTRFSNGKVLAGFGGIEMAGDGTAYLENSDVNITLRTTDGTPVVNTAGAIVGGNLNVSNSNLRIRVIGMDVYNASGIYNYNTFITDNSNVTVNVEARYSAKGITPEDKFYCENSNVDVNVVPSSIRASQILGIAADNITIDQTGENHAVHSYAEGGIAICSKTGKSGREKKHYSGWVNPSSISLENEATVTTPHSYDFSLTSINGAEDEYIYLETIYDKDFTDKPADDVTIGSVRAALAHKLYDAMDFYASVKTSTDGSDISRTKMWCDEAAKINFNNKIQDWFTIYLSGDDFQVVTAFDECEVYIKEFQDKLKYGTYKSIEDISFDKEEIEADVGETLTLNVEYGPDDATIPEIKFTSSDPNIVSVDSSGKIRGNKVGKATVTVTYLDDTFTGKYLKARCTIFISANKTVLKTLINTAEQLRDLIQVSYDYGETVPENQFWTYRECKEYFDMNIQEAKDVLKNKNATQKEVDDAVDRLNEDGLLFAERIFPGIYIQAYSIAMDKTSLAMKTGEKYKLDAHVLPQNANVQSISWDSDNEDIAYVETDGTIVAVGEGTAIITAKSDDGTLTNPVTGSCKVTVTKKDDEEITTVTPQTNPSEVTTSAQETTTQPSEIVTTKKDETTKPKVKTIKVNTKTVNSKSIKAAIKKAKTSSDVITKIVLGKKVKKISKKAFIKYKKLTTLEIKTKKLTKKKVKKSLLKSRIKNILVKVGKKKTNKKYIAKYVVYFKKKNSGKKVIIK